MRHNLVFRVFLMFFMYLKICYEKREKPAHFKWKNPTKDHPMQMNKDGRPAK